MAKRTPPADPAARLVEALDRIDLADLNGASLELCQRHPAGCEAIKAAVRAIEAYRAGRAEASP